MPNARPAPFCKGDLEKICDGAITIGGICAGIASGGTALAATTATGIALEACIEQALLKIPKQMKEKIKLLRDLKTDLSNAIAKKHIHKIPKIAKNVHTLCK